MHHEDEALFQTKEARFNAEKERALLVGVTGLKEGSSSLSLDELERLTDTAGAVSVGRITQRLSSINPRTFIGSGKVEEIAAACEEMDINVVIFDEELSPTQQQNLEKSFPRDVKVIDRTALILDIFALHATTREGYLQVRLAQNQYLLPRLRGMWAHLASNRMGGGVGSRFGEGESQLEVDRRMVRKRIISIKRELEKLESVRYLQQEKLQESGLFKVALAGYTNAGKSSLLNTLTHSNVLSYDKLFATLDSTTRRLNLESGREVTLTDTVGFIQKLPTTLIESFKSTLEGIKRADFILHVIDATAENYLSQIDAVEEVFEEIKVNTIPCLKVFNKIDLLDDITLEGLKRRNPQAVFVSAHEKAGIPELIKLIEKAACASEELMCCLIPYSRGDLVSFAHESCSIKEERFTETGTEISLYVPERYRAKFSAYVVADDNISAANE